MKILVCITHVPDTTSKINFTENNTKFDTSGVQFIIGPYDDYALARAVELKESLSATLTVLNVGLVETEKRLRSVPMMQFALTLNPLILFLLQLKLQSTPKEQGTTSSLWAGNPLITTVESFTVW